MVTDDIILTFIYKNGSSERIESITELHFIKDVYEPATHLTATLRLTEPRTDIKRIKFSCAGRLIHDGYVEYTKQETKRDCLFFSFRSRGWSLMLAQNEPVPGLNYSVDLETLGRINTNIPNVTFESGTQTVNYIYVKEHSTIWEAINIYSMKAYGKLPFIMGTNCVTVTEPRGTDRSYMYEIISESAVKDKRTRLSKAYMADMNGDYTYSLENTDASADGIVRERYYGYDRQWVMIEQQGLQYKLDMADRRRNVHKIRVIGYSGEELYDRFTVMLGSTEKIGRIELDIGRGCITTEISSYG